MSNAERRHDSVLALSFNAIFIATLFSLAIAILSMPRMTVQSQVRCLGIRIDCSEHYGIPIGFSGPDRWVFQSDDFSGFRILQSCGLDPALQKGLNVTF
jgi:hypothetical protein